MFSVQIAMFTVSEIVLREFFHSDVWQPCVRLFSKKSG